MLYSVPVPHDCVPCCDLKFFDNVLYYQAMTEADADGCDLKFFDNVLYS